MADLKSCDEWKPFMAMITIDFAFSIVNILLKKVLDEGINHLVLITYRLLISAIFLGPIGYFRERGSRPKLTFRILCYLFLSAIVGASLTQYSFLIGIQYTSASFACAFINMVPVVTFIMALPFKMETVHIKSNTGKAKVLGALVCVSGAMVLTLYRGAPLFNNSPSQAVTRAMDHSLKLSLSKRAERWTLGCIALLVGTLLCQLFYALSTERSLSIWVLKGKTEIITVLYAGMIGSGLCNVGMAWCVQKRGPVFTAAFSPLVQIMAAILDVPILHEELYLGSVLGSIFVMIGLYILLWGKSKEMKNHATRVAQEAEETKEQEVVTVSCDSRCP
ncbi:hypothetical protein OIU85_002787 [Salix viminalis]|uniref:WAT1-related protein n=1 Tax=Salix viminalis TaxID=40686 RepID=A0A9Q0VP36_SALVM|nr:hypothetical protein OIU85_002787 [Salix viminalis]